VVEGTEALFKSGLVLAADEGIEECGTEIPVPLQQFENLDVTCRELDALAGTFAT